MKITARLADMLLYEIPDVKYASVRIDVYSTFRAEAGDSSQRCILTTTVDREAAEDLDWDGLPAEEIVAFFGGRFELNEHGAAVPIEIEAPAPPEAVPGTAA
jgi:hypothetical protein